MNYEAVFTAQARCQVEPTSCLIFNNSILDDEDCFLTLKTSILIFLVVPIPILLALCILNSEFGLG